MNFYGIVEGKLMKEKVKIIKYSMKRKEVIGSGNSMGTTKILVANSKGEEIFKLKDDTITININNIKDSVDVEMSEAVELNDIIKCIVDFDDTETDEIKGRYFSTIQRDLRNLKQQKQE